ncbi:MAG: tetratricopeptide repeat protein [Elusimicrobia bacterium]|nr:tetratricopeptide repeat protein [Elusimicrobiota bacterium]
MSERRGLRLALAALCLLAAPGRAGAAISLRWRSEEFKKVETLFEERRYAEVVKALSGQGLTRLRFSGRLCNAYVYLGFSHEQLGQYDKAMGVYQLGAQLCPRDRDLLTRLGLLQHAMQLDEAARSILERVVQADPRHTTALVALAEIERNLGFLDRSVDYYERALEIRDEDAALYRTYAEALYDRRDFSLAEVAIRWSLKLEDAPESRLVLARIRRSLGFAMEAAEIVRQAEEDAPIEDRLSYAMTAAVWHMEAGQWHNAWSQAGLVLQRRPDHPLARYVRARAYLQTGRPQLALKDLAVAAAGPEPFVAKASAALAREIEKSR